MAKATTPRRTPGRTHGGGDKYILFNDNPRQVGTQSGRPMPNDIPMNDDGFEDPAAFMRSPTASVMNSASRRTTMGGVSVAPSSVGQARRRTLGRMSQMDGSDEDDIGYPPHDDFDDDVGNNTFFGRSNPTNVSLPRPSHLGPATPTTGYDDLPSPSVSRSASKRKSAFGLSPSGSRRVTKSSTLRSPLADQDVDDDSMVLGYDDDMDQTASPSSKKRKPSRHQPEPGADEDEDVDEDEGYDSTALARNRSAKQSLASTRPAMDEDDDAEDFYDAPADLDDADLGSGGYDDDIADDGPSGVNASDFDEEEETVNHGNQVDMDEDAGEGEGSVDQGSEEEDEEESAVERATTKKKVPKVTKPGHKRAARIEEHVPVAKSARLSGVDFNDSGRYRGDFRSRRTKRVHYAPLEYWKGDRVVYKKGEHLAEVEEVVRVVKEEPIPFAQRRKPARRQNQTRNGRGSTDFEDIDDGTGVDQATIVEGLVAKFPKELYIEGDEDAEDRRIIAMPHHRLAPRLDRPEFEYQKVFGESAFAAGGIIRIPIGQTKPAKSSKDNAFFFFVYKGGLNVSIHRTNFNIGPGGMFLVPRDNKYSIRNISEVKAEIFFAQARQSAPEEDPTQEVLRASTTPAPRVKKVKKKVAAPPVSEVDATPKAEKRKPGRPRKS